MIPLVAANEANAMIGIGRVPIPVVIGVLLLSVWLTAWAYIAMAVFAGVCAGLSLWVYVRP